MRAAWTVVAGLALLTVAAGGCLAGTYWADAQQEPVQRVEVVER